MWKKLEKVEKYVEKMGKNRRRPAGGPKPTQNHPTEGFGRLGVVWEWFWCVFVWFWVVSITEFYF